MNDKNQTKEPAKTIRCAIYTRVSTTDNLEQDFTSLDVQRESAESFIASQKQEGWIASSQRYDDAGFTGANTERPALKQLIEHIKAKEVDCVVVYKVDRLSRSLLDFSQLLEFFDKNNVAFVSVTQNFNTKTSMGRLTLNILLSFAQFEREMISERTRDKMAAAKKKGKFIGGRPALGYNIDPINHKLITNPAEVKLVKEVFDLYLEKKSLIEVTKILNAKAYKTKEYTSRKGLKFGAQDFQNTSVQRILRNILYTGRVQYQNEFYDGQQEAFIPIETFQKVQKILDENYRTPQRLERKKGRGILSQILRCKSCDSAMVYTYVYKREKRHKYMFYICSKAAKRGYGTCPTPTIPAHLAEDRIMDCLKQIPTVRDFIGGDWNQISIDQRREKLGKVIREINYDNSAKILTITTIDENKSYTFEADFKKAKPEKPEVIIKKEPQLRQNLALAHQIQNLMDNDPAMSVKQIAGWLNLTPARVNQFMNMLLLAPAIQEQILFEDDEKIVSIPEYKINEISREMIWDKQIEVWQRILHPSTL